MSGTFELLLITDILLLSMDPAFAGTTFEC